MQFGLFFVTIITQLIFVLTLSLVILIFDY